MFTRTVYWRIHSRHQPVAGEIAKAGSESVWKTEVFVGARESSENIGPNLVDQIAINEINNHRWPRDCLESRQASWFSWLVRVLLLK
jgi:hypothetical protein